MASGSRDSLWTTSEVVRLVTAEDVGGLLRHVRRTRHLRQSDVADAVSCSPSTISRIESGARSSTDMPLLRSLADVLEVPADVLGAALGLRTTPSSNVARVRDAGLEEDPIRRRAFLAAGAAVPVVGLATMIDRALAVPSRSSMVDVRAGTQLLARARFAFDAGRSTQLAEMMPSLFEMADYKGLREGPPGSHYAATVYALATEALAKVGHIGAARITADRAVRHGQAAESAVAQATAARTLSIVLRHQGSADTANEVTAEALDLVADSGLRSASASELYAQMLCTHAYVSARSEKRDAAVAAIHEAVDVVDFARRRLPENPQRFGASHVLLYAVGVHWALGDCGLAIEAGRKVDLSQLSTGERVARYHTDMARAWWQWGKAERTASSLLAAAIASRSEVCDRSAIRAIGRDLVTKFPHLAESTVLRPLVLSR